eukprot:jgi/Mesen1/8839/ME000053S08235
MAAVVAHASIAVSQLVHKKDAVSASGSLSQQVSFLPLKQASLTTKRMHAGVLRAASGKQTSRSIVATATSAGEAVTSSESAQKTTYHFVVANAKFMLDDEEHFQELMKERLRHFGDIGREQDFWLVYEPSFLDQMPEVTKRLSRPAVALVSTDDAWMTFMKLRLDRVLRGQYEASSVEEALKSKPVDVKFDRPASWVAPYPKYEGDWWTPFLPKTTSS